jgi:murein DD-endopeptidase MepM/ murein hydrolase activator NlpD
VTRDDRLYAFIVAHTSRSRAQIRRITIHKRWLKFATVLACATICTALYGIYGAFQQAAHLRIERENVRLRTENEQQRQQLKQLENRVTAIEDKSRRIAEMSGVPEQHTEPSTPQSLHGAGGPLVKLDAAGIAAVEQQAAQLEQQLRGYEVALRERARIPSIWPVAGELNDGFGVRCDPFGGGGSEFHMGQDIMAAPGTPVVAAAEGTVSFAGWKNGYGQVVEIDHGNGLTTRYGHLSKIETTVGQQLARGELLGRVGSTGRSTGPHLHYEVRINDMPVSPLAYLPQQGADSAGK